MISLTLDRFCRGSFRLSETGFDDLVNRVDFFQLLLHLQSQPLVMTETIRIPDIDKIAINLPYLFDCDIRLKSEHLIASGKFVHLSSVSILIGRGGFNEIL